MKEAEERALDHAGEHEVEASSATHLAERIIAKSDNSNPVVKYLGFSLLLTYHYVLWFEPNSFFATALLSFNVTSMWLVNLIGTSIGVGVIAAIEESAISRIAPPFPMRPRPFSLSSRCS